MISLTEMEPEVLELLPMFLEGSRTRLESLSGLLAERQFAEIQRLGHGLKGTSAMYQLPEFAELGRELEEAAQAADVAAISRCGSEWQRQIEALAAVLD